ncbi:MAG: hypothetical protein HQL95_13610 [Magnetococcales bacterium]|nr:hypothetical protein [Magnetococcales bacterium]
MARMIQVLVIDRERLERVLLRGILENVGLQVLDAPGDRMGLQVLRAAPCDLVITDQWSTNLRDATDLSEMLGEFPHTRIIALASGGTPRNLSSAMESALRQDRMRILVKPVFQLKLLETIQELFTDWRPEESAWDPRGL